MRAINRGSDRLLALRAMPDNLLESRIDLASHWLDRDHRWHDITEWLVDRDFGVRLSLGTGSSFSFHDQLESMLRDSLGYSKFTSPTPSDAGPAPLSLIAPGGPVDGGPIFVGDDIGDTIGTASSMTVNSTVFSEVHAAVSGQSDRDFFSISLVAGQTYTFSLEKMTLGSELDCYLELRNSAGTILAEDDDGGIFINSFFTFTATQSGTYYVVARSFDVPSQPDSTGSYALTVNTLQTGNSSPTSFTPNGHPQFSWDQSAIQIGAGFQTVDSTNWPGDQASWASRYGQSVVVTYAYRDIAPATMPGGTSGFSAFNAAQILAAERALQYWAAVANITFVRVNDGDGYGNDAAILFGNYSSGAEGAAAFAFLPLDGDTSADALQGDVWINSTLATNSQLGEGQYGLHTLVHEIGHALGLNHPGEYNAGPGVSPTYDSHAEYFNDSGMFTVMTYFSGVFTGGNLSQYGTLPLLHDIAAIQRLYGANLATRSGDTIYGFNSNTGVPEYAMTLASHGAVFAIWDGGGIDTLDLSGYTTNSTIDLRQEAFSSAGPGSSPAVAAVYNISIARGVVIENAIGGSGNDTIIGNSANNTLTGNGGTDTITGGDGNDTLIGGAGADNLNGGDGDDAIFWDAGDNLANVLGGAGTDVIVFTSGLAPTTFNLTSHGFEGGEGRFTDTGANPWATRTDYYDSLWRADRTFTVNDNGTSENLDYDQANAFNWGTYFLRYDTLQRTIESVLVYDDNTRDSVNFDAANAFNWTQFFWREDAAALRIESVLVYDDGGRDSNNYDAADNFNWNEFFWKEDNLARRLEAVLIYDDGGRDSNNYDAVDAFDWTEFFWKEDSLGRRIESVLIYDDSSTDSINYDAVDAFNWDTFFWREDTLGRRTEDILIYDDGSRDAKDYDETNSFTWANIFRHYDPGGTLIQTITTMDDGSIIFS